MDNTDYKIIEILQEEGRISMKDLGKIVGLTSPAVSERVRRLEEAGVIEGYKAIVNPNALGRVIKAFVHVSLPSNKYNEFLEWVGISMVCYPEWILKDGNIKNRLYYSTKKKHAGLTIVVDFESFVYGSREEKADIVSRHCLRGLAY